MDSILIVDDDVTYGMMLQTWLTKKGFAVRSATSVARAIKLIEAEAPRLILSDLRMPNRDGMDLLKWLTARTPSVPLIMMTGYGDIASAVEAIKMGAKDYVTKPVQPDVLLAKIAEALHGASAESAVPASSSTFSASQPASSTSQSASSVPAEPTHLEGESEVARRLYSNVRLVAPTNLSVLINGASGTGKEYVAHRIHSLSPRAGKPFIAMDCGAIPKDLAASEFFGHVKGAFTGALTDKTGAFLEANGGTLFLDEIGNLSYEIQVQLLRALQERKVRPVGSTKEIQVDVRLVSATNENLEEAIARGTFREDLYHRLNEFTLRMPLLHERGEDVVLFAQFFLRQANQEFSKQLKGFDREALKLIQGYAWPGNLRQMKNIVRRAALLAQGHTVDVDALSELVELQAREAQQAGAARTQALMSMNEMERQQIIEALRQTGNHKSRAAQLLGIDRKTLYNKMKEYGL